MGEINNQLKQEIEGLKELTKIYGKIWGKLLEKQLYQKEVLQKHIKLHLNGCTEAESNYKAELENELKRISDGEKKGDRLE